MMNSHLTDTYMVFWTLFLGVSTSQTSDQQFRPQLFKSWIALSSGLISIQCIVQSVSLILIHWIEIYPLDSAIQLSNNRGQLDNLREPDSQMFVQGHFWERERRNWERGGDDKPQISENQAKPE